MISLSGFIPFRYFVESSWYVCFAWQAFANVKCGASFCGNSHYRTSASFVLQYTKRPLCGCTVQSSSLPDWILCCTKENVSDSETEF